MIIMLLGKSASGKTTMKDMIEELHPNIHQVLSTTTRPKRAGEIDGKDYRFVTDEEFEVMYKNNELVEFTKYRGWYYGIEKAQLPADGVSLVVTDIEGFRNFKRAGIDVLSIYIDTDDTTRYVRQLLRGDNIVEVALRSERDSACFQNIEKDVDYVVTNNTTDPTDCYGQIINAVIKEICLEEIEGVVLHSEAAERITNVIVNEVL